MVPGYLTPSAHPASLLLAARVLQQQAVPGAVISHATAAELLRMPLPFELEYEQSQVLHCTVAPEAPRRSGHGVVKHTGPTGPTMRIDGVRVSGPVTLLQELAGVLDHGDLVACCDHLVGPLFRGRPRVRLAQLRQLVESAGSGYRIRRVRAAVRDARERVESPKETETRLLLHEHGFVEPVINLPVQAPGTRENFRIDLSYPELWIAIEYDGFWHSTDRRRHRKDRRKDDVLHELGWRVVRASDEDLRSPGNFLGRLTHLGAPRA